MFIGTRVSHPKYGKGVVIGQWGSWFSCRSCIAEMPLGSIKMLSSHMTKRGFDSRMKLTPMQCPVCRDMMIPLQVNAKEIVDVKFFDGVIRPINQVWLKSSLRRAV